MFWSRLQVKCNTMCYQILLRSEQELTDRLGYRIRSVIGRETRNLQQKLILNLLTLVLNTSYRRPANIFEVEPHLSLLKRRFPYRNSDVAVASNSGQLLLFYVCPRQVA